MAPSWSARRAAAERARRIPSRRSAGKVSTMKFGRLEPRNMGNLGLGQKSWKAMIHHGNPWYLRDFRQTRMMTEPNRTIERGCCEFRAFAALLSQPAESVVWYTLGLPNAAGVTWHQISCQCRNVSHQTAFVLPRLCHHPRPGSFFSRQGH